MFPHAFWLYDHPGWRKGSASQKMGYAFHCGVFLLGCFMCVAGTYSTVQLIINAYANGTIGT